MTLNEAKAVIYGNVVYACEKAGFPLETTQLVQEACDTIIALANACETIITLADRKTEPQTDYLEYHTDTTHFGKVKGKSVTTNKIDDEPQIIACPINERAEYWFYEDEPTERQRLEGKRWTDALTIEEKKQLLDGWIVDEPHTDGILFKGNLKEGEYKLIKTTDGWVLANEDIVYCGWERSE